MFCSYLNNRKIEIVNDVYENYDMGTPQGSSSSCIMVTCNKRIIKKLGKE